MAQKTACREKKVILLVAVLTLLLNSISLLSYGQENGSIGIGTETPNTNAVLELVSPTNNQGLLVPRLTTVQRTASEFIDGLSALENGLLVFDTDVNSFFFWLNDEWIEVGNTQFTAGTGIEISNGTISNTGDDDSDPLNEIQTISLSNDSLVLSNGGGSVAIDTDSGDEIQTLTFSSDTLYLSDGGAVAIDSSLTNELQTITLLNDTLFLSNGGAVPIDSSLTNEIQDLSISANVLTITNNTGATSIDLSTYLDNTDDQQLTFSGTDLTIEDGNTIDLSSLVDDGDADPTNEIQDLNLSASNTLTITGNSSATEIDLSPFSGTNTDNQSLTYDDSRNTISISNGNTIDISDLATDGDSDPTNEIELPSTASTGDILVYDGSNWVSGTDNVDDGDTDDTNEIELPSTASNGDILVYDGSNWVAGIDNVNDGDTDDTNEIELPSTASEGEVLTYSRGNWVAGTDEVDDNDNDPNNEIELPSTASSGDILVYNGSSWVAGTDNVNDGDTDNTNEIELPASADSGDILVYNGSSWVAGTDNVADNDNSSTNEIQGLSYNATSNTLSISTSGSSSVNLSELDDTFSSPWDESGSVANYPGSYASANNFVSTPNPNIISISNGSNSITVDDIKSSKILQIKGADGAGVVGIDPGVNGQELICIVVDAQAIFVNQSSGQGSSSLYLSANNVNLGVGSTIYLVYNEEIRGWLEISHSVVANKG